MSNRDEFCLGNEIGFAIIISRRGEKLFPLQQSTIFNHSIIIKTIKGEDLCVCSENALVD
jgi:hypothetical protein